MGFFIDNPLHNHYLAIEIFKKNYFITKNKIIFYLEFFKRQSWLFWIKLIN